MLKVFVRLIILASLVIGTPIFAQMPGTFMPVMRTPDAIVAFTATATTTTPSASQNFASFNIGIASSTRYVVCAVYFRATVVPDTISAVTINSVSATKLVSLDGDAGANTNETGIWIALVPTGTSVTINVTSTTAGVEKDIGCWTVTNLLNGGVATNTQSTAVYNSTMTLTSILAGGVAIAAGGNSGGGTFTWSGVTEDFDMLSAGTRAFSGASLPFAAAQTSYGITANQTVTGSNYAAVAVSLR